MYLKIKSSKVPRGEHGGREKREGGGGALGWPIRKGSEGWAWAGAEGVVAIITRRPCDSQPLPWLARSFVSVSHSFHILTWG